MPSPSRPPTQHPLQPLLRAATFCAIAFLLAAPGHLHAGEGLGTFTNRLVIAEHLLLAKVVETTRTKGVNPGSTTFQVVEVFRDKHNKFHADQKFTKVSGGREKPGSLMLLWKFPPQYEMNHGSTEIWQVATDDVRRFIREIPPEKPAKPGDPQRLDYFVQHLEHLDPVIAEAAFEELATAPTAEQIRIARQFHAEGLREWLNGKLAIKDKTRRGYYAMMLGFCGNATDLPLYKRFLLAPVKPDELRMELRGFTIGYLLLTGPDGLAELEQTKMDPLQPFAEIYGIYSALCDLHSLDQNRIPKARLQQSVHRLLEHPEIADVVINRLAQWKDWSVQAEVFQLYDRGGRFESRSLRRAIIRYLLTCSTELPPGTPPDAPLDKLPPHAPSRPLRPLLPRHPPPTHPQPRP